ncbi:uncharacterized protein LOC144641728 [Oculina patagonica]
MAEKAKKLVSSEDVKNFLNLQEQLDELRDTCQKYLKPAIARHGVDTVVSNLMFPELTKSLSKRGNDEGILVDNLQRFRIFHAAMRLVTKSAKSADDNERRQEPSEKMELLLKDMTSVIWRVLRINNVSIPQSPSSDDLEKNLKKTTKDFLEVFSGLNKENIGSDVTGGEDATDSDDRAVYDVRNYVILRDLGYMLLEFTRDLGHLIR